MIFIDINKFIGNLENLSKNKEFDKIKTLTHNFEKHVLDNCKTEYEFKNLIDDLTLYSDYTLLNTLLVREQYPNFLSLGTKKSFNDMGIKLLDNAKPILILRPINEEFVSIKKDNKEVIKSINDLNRTELKQYYDKDNQDIVFHHNNFIKLERLKVYDVKDTTMNKLDYEQEPLPALFFSSYDDIYNSFVKALYADGYKIKYTEMFDKISFNKDDNTFSLKKGLNKKTHLLLLLDTYTNNVSTNKMEKDMLDMVISRHLGIDKDGVEYDSFNKWFKQQDPKKVDHLLKVLISKGRKFTNNFNRFYEMELQEKQKSYIYEENDLYDDFNFSIN